MKKSILLPTLLSSMALVLTACGGGGSSDSGERPEADTVAPVITMTGGNITINQGLTYVDAGATAEDDVDGSISVITANNVNTSVVGDHTVVYTAIDAAGNESSLIRTVTVNDVTSPIISVIGGTATVVEGTAYNDAGANAIDLVDGNVAVIATTIDTTIAGVQTVTYTAVDAAGNSSTAQRIVKIIRPASFDEFDGTWRGTCLSTDVLEGTIAATQEFSLVSGKLVNNVKTYATSDCTGDVVHDVVAEADVVFGGPSDNQTDKGVCIAEMIDIDITSASINGYVQGPAEIPGFITLTRYPVYNLFCLNPNGKLVGGRLSSGDGLSDVTRPTEMATSEESKYTKVDTIVPSIIMVGSDDITIDVGTTYVDAGASAIDDQDGVLPVTVTGVVDPNIPDTYKVVYSASDAEGNTTEATRVVKVVRGAGTFATFDGEWKSECLSNSNPALVAVGVRALNKLYTISDDVNYTAINGFKSSNCSGQPHYLGLAAVDIVYSGEIDEPSCATGKAEKIDLTVTEARINNSSVLSEADLNTFMAATEFPTYNIMCIDTNGELREGNTVGELNGLKETKRPNEIDMTGDGLVIQP